MGTRLAVLLVLASVVTAWAGAVRVANFESGDLSGWEEKAVKATSFSRAGRRSRARWRVDSRGRFGYKP